MYLFTVVSALLCIQLAVLASSESVDVSSNRPSSDLISIDNDEQSNSDSNEETDSAHRLGGFLRFDREALAPTGSFLRFGREAVAPTGSFLRFGREALAPTGSFLRFGREALAPTGSFLRFGRETLAPTGSFLRFGRRAQRAYSNRFLRFDNKGEFLRFG